MYESLQRLPKLDHRFDARLSDSRLQQRIRDDTAVGVGIERFFTLDRLTLNAPISLEDFVAAKPEIDKGIADESNSELVCGLIRSNGCTGSCAGTAGPRRIGQSS